MRRRRLLTGTVLVVVVAGWLLVPAAGRAVGSWLVVSDQLEPGQAIVVLGGRLPVRALAAADLYHHSLAPQVWLMMGRNDAEDRAYLKSLDLPAEAEYEYSYRVLVRRGVPDSAIRVVPGFNVNTADEIRTLAAFLRTAGSQSVIVVTSRFHTRRVRLLWAQLVGAQPRLLVYGTTDDEFDAAAWWRNTRDTMVVAREYFGMLNARLGFPVAAAQ